MGSQRTTAAFGIAGSADFSAKPYDSVAEIAAFLRGQDFPKLTFYLLRFFAFRKTQTTADTDTVGVANHAAGYLENIA